jgi:hypothetical protein
LLAIHIPEAQSFPFLQAFPDLPEPVEIIIFIEARLLELLGDLTEGADVGMGPCAAAAARAAEDGGGITGIGSDSDSATGLSWNPSIPIRRPKRRTALCVSQKMTTKMAACVAATTSFEQFLGNRTMTPGVKTAKSAAI